TDRRLSLLNLGRPLKESARYTRSFMFLFILGKKTYFFTLLLETLETLETVKMVKASQASHKKTARLIKLKTMP
ncbi:MAG: hypothetical protein WCJ33_03215, partial [Pseudomonadota bacterium]